MPNKKNMLEADDIILHLRTLMGEKEVTRRKLVVTAAKLAATALKLAVTAKEKESAKRKLAVTATELAATAIKLAATAAKKENFRLKLAATAARLALTAENLAIAAKGKEDARRKLTETAARLAATADKLAESVRQKLVVTAEKLAVAAGEKEDARQKLVITARKLAATAKENESVRKKLVVVAKKLKKSHETLEKKVAERTQSLKMSRVKEEAILLSLGDGIIATDEKGNITIVNRAAERLLGKKSSEIAGRNFSDVSSLVNEKGVRIPPELNPIALALKSLVTTKTGIGSTYYHMRKDGTKFPVAITATPVILSGNVIGAIKVFRDITHDREIDKAKTEFVSLASHQLRTPLSAVNWYAEMLLAGDVGKLNEKQQHYLEEVYRSNQRMVELVNALLDVSSLELGTFVIEPESVDICKLTESVINEQIQQIDAKKMVFAFSCEKNVTFMRTDPRLLRMVMQNILSNSIKYTPEGGKIDFTISLADPPSQKASAGQSKKNVLIKISDTGYGIPKSQQDRIFTKLFRAENVKDKDTDGTGLGLYIVKSIVENAGGSIWFFSPKTPITRGKYSKYPGTTFYVSLPLSPAKKSNKH